MACSIPVASGNGDLQWSDTNDSADSDDIHSMGFESPWLRSLSRSSTSVSMASSMSISQTGQLSPISTGMDTGMDAPCSMADNATCASSASCSPTGSNSGQSASSSGYDGSWTMASYVGGSDGSFEMGGSSDSHGDAWEHQADDAQNYDILTVPKLEPMDDDGFRLDDLKAAPLAADTNADAPAQAQPKTKRPRGRPRKHPLTPIVTANKVTKGRSKTGCLTCRKRKKKCDEAKPRCMNCYKNAVICEGYPEKTVWKSGKEKAEEERMKSNSCPSITLQPLFHGLETVEDMIFWKHYNEHLSTVLTVEGEHKNAFKDMLVPLAVKHQGLMHSILSLASKHIDYETPYGMNLLRNNPNTTLEALQERSDYHSNNARTKFLQEKDGEDGMVDSGDNKVIRSATLGQMLCFLLESMAKGDSEGEHRIHLKAYYSMIQSAQPEDPAFLAFITEFFQYHIYVDELICFPDGRERYLTSSEPIVLPPMHPPRLLGVADGLLKYMSEITTIRNTIRDNMAAQLDPVVEYGSLYSAVELEIAIRNWKPHWPPGDSRERVGQLYKQMLWIYLFRTVYPPSTSSQPSTSLAFFAPSMSMMPNSSVVNTPPHSASTSCASSPRLAAGSNAAFGFHHSRETPPSRKSSSAGALPFIDAHQINDSSRAESPPPIRQPPDQDRRITLAVDEALAILDSFKPSDPSQTLLLLPCLVIGTACFTPSKQDRIRAAVRTVRGYTGLRNTDCVLHVLEEIWHLMEVGEWVSVWDWQRVIRDKGIDFLPA